MRKLLHFFIFCFIIQSVAFAQSYKVGHTVIVFNDAARDKRKIQTDVYYPAEVSGENVPIGGNASTQFPVVIIGHGFVMSTASYENIYSKLAAEGYIVALPRTESSLTPNQVSFAKDLAFLVNAIQGQSAMKNTVFTGKVNSKSCVIGHSMGGGCAVLAGIYNPNITTLIGLAPAETNPSCIEAASRVYIPTLILTGSNDCITPIDENSKPLYNALSANCKSMITIKGGSHCQFANSNANCNFGESTCSPAPAITRAVQQSISMHYMLLWLDYKLKNDCNARFTFEEDLETAIDVTYLQNCAVPVSCIAPKNKITTDISGTSVKLKWKPVSCVFTYELRYKSSQSSIWNNIGTIGNVTTYALTGLQPGLTYEWSVRTICDDDATLASNWGNKKTFTTATAKVTGFDAPDNSENEFVITPNPSVGKFVLTGTLTTIKPIAVAVYNCIGKKVFEIVLKTKDPEFTYTIDIGNEPAGIYIVRINCGDQVETQRIIKK
jgi:alpha-beta hydrolase superfamily lysophospholipase